MSEEYEGLTVAEALEREQEAPEIEVIEIDEPGDDLDEVKARLGVGEGVDPLDALLGAQDGEITDTVYLPRLKAHFIVAAIVDDREYDKLVERCTTIVKNRRSGRTRELDGRKLARLTVATYCIEPAFTPKRDRAAFEKLAERYGTREPETLVQRALLIGEVDKLADKIMDLSGFEDEVETAGN